MRHRSFGLVVLAVLLFGCADVAVEPRSEPIVGGSADELRHAVGWLRYRRDGVDAGCSGTLIAPRSFLTAAHCVLPDDELVAVTFEDSGGRSLVVAAEAATAFPEWAGASDSQLGRDIAVVKLAEPMSAIEPVFPAPAPAPGETVTLVAWGNDRPMGGFGARRTLDLPVARLRPGTFDYGESGATTCFGDSGGAVLRDVGGVARVAGVMAYNLPPACDGRAGATIVGERIEDFVRPLLERDDPLPPLPTITVSPNRATAGGSLQITVSIDSAVPVDQVEATIDGGEPIALTGAPPTWSATVPAPSPGTLQVSVRTVDAWLRVTAATGSVTVTPSGSLDADANVTERDGGADPAMDAGVPSHSSPPTVADDGCAAGGGASRLDVAALVLMGLAMRRRGRRKR